MGGWFCGVAYLHTFVLLLMPMLMLILLLTLVLILMHHDHASCSCSCSSHAHTRTHAQVEILRNESLSKDKALGEEVRIHQNEQNPRDAMRVEQNKLLNALRIKQSEESQQMNEMIKLNAIVNK